MEKKLSWVISESDPTLRKCLSELGAHLGKQFMARRKQELQNMIQAAKEIKETKPTIH